jgi:hypothetical protein
MQLAGGRGQPAEIRDQTSEVRVKLISDLRLLTSVIDDFYDFYAFYDFYDFNDFNDFYDFNDLKSTIYNLKS